MRIVFHATLKPPDHPVPSGDRLIARLIFDALRRAGGDVRIVSRVSTRSRDASPDALERLRAAAAGEIDRILAKLDDEEDGWRPELVFTYHLYYKAPDWIGSGLARRLAVPYAIAEASYAGKRDSDAWALWQQEAVTQMKRAERIFCLTPRDRAGLEPILESRRLIDLPPFLATDDWPEPAERELDVAAPVQLITVAMMRAADKLESYRHVAQALRLVRADWRLSVVGGGPAENDVRQLFADFPSRCVRFTGTMDEDAVRGCLAGADLFVWPGIGEAIGMVYLEAGAQGVPVIAYDTAGVRSVVRTGVTGLLTPEGDAAAFAAAIDALAGDLQRRRTLGRNALRFVRDERSLAVASRILSSELLPLIADHRIENGSAL